MGQLVADLPTRSEDDMGSLLVFDDTDEDFAEGNVITVPQVNEATAKYWDVLHYVEGSGWGPYAGSEFLLGDVNGDGTVNITDVTILVNMLATGNPSANEHPAADLDASGVINITDVTMLINQVMHSTKKVAHQSPEGKVNLVKGRLLIDDEPVILEINPKLN